MSVFSSTVTMVSWQNWLLRLTFCHGFLTNFSTAYIDFNGRLVKLFFLVKIFVYLQEFCFIAYEIHIFPTGYQLRKSVSIGEVLNFYAMHFCRVFFSIIFLLWRIKGDRAYIKCLESLDEMQTKYFDNLQQTTNDKTMKIYLILNIIIVNINNWYGSIIHNALLHHAIALYCVNNCYTKLNNELQHNRAEPPLGKIYVKLSFLFKQVNIIFGPIIFGVLLCLLFLNALFCHSFVLDITRFGFVIVFDSLKWELSVFIFYYIDMCLYYLICDRLRKTLIETDRITLEYISRNRNYEVEIFNLIRTTLRPKVKICRMFHIDLNSLLQLIMHEYYCTETRKFINGKKITLHKFNGVY
ncbi:hypothetical protein CVS40_8915 [Lucilia cuprina]|nr:hypothetical protein CVS40_8915 [Lucilia cuprina]